MTRPIDADALTDEVDKYIYRITGGSKRKLKVGESAIIADIKAHIKLSPTIDAVPRWIPCSERLPEDDRSKVVTLANGNAEVGYYSNGDWWCVGDKFTLENPTVIAWMPLPKPYEVENEKTD